jgi:hypothetical protein
MESRSGRAVCYVSSMTRWASHVVGSILLEVFALINVPSLGFHKSLDPLTCLAAVPASLPPPGPLRGAYSVCNSSPCYARNKDDHQFSYFLFLEICSILFMSSSFASDEPLPPLYRHPRYICTPAFLLLHPYLYRMILINDVRSNQIPL